MSRAMRRKTCSTVAGRPQIQLFTSALFFFISLWSTLQMAPYPMKIRVFTRTIKEEQETGHFLDFSPISIKMKDISSTKDSPQIPHLANPPLKVPLSNATRHPTHKTWPAQRRMDTPMCNQKSVKKKETTTATLVIRSRIHTGRRRSRALYTHTHTHRLGRRPLYFCRGKDTVRAVVAAVLF